MHTNSYKCVAEIAKLWYKEIIGTTRIFGQHIRKLAVKPYISPKAVIVRYCL